MLKEEQKLAERSQYALWNRQFQSHGPAAPAQTHTVEMKEVQLGHSSDFLVTYRKDYLSTVLMGL